MSRVCCVCTESKEGTENPLFRCGGQPGQGCGIVVHQACYGIVTPPTGIWFCRKCESQERAARVKCELCPRKDGALKRTDSGGWAHVVCALYIPEVTFGNLRTMEPVITSKLPRERFAKTCSICEHKGLETTGACMSCHKSNCRLAFHVTCAQRENLLVEEEDQRDSRNIIYCGYCHTHYRRMIRQKRKQTLRKNTTEGEGGAVSGNTDIPGGGHAHFIPVGGTDSDDPVAMAGIEKPRHKNTADSRLTKRPHTDAQTSAVGGTGSVQKRKFSRKRKISSSNESTTSEALSNASEAHNMVGSPSGIVHMYSPTPFHPGSGAGTNSYKRPALGEGDRTGGISTAPATLPTDCDNLDLLASVTQRVNTNHPPSSLGTTSALATGKKSRSHPSIGVATTNSSSLQPHHAGANSIYPPVTAVAGSTGGKKKRTSAAGSAKQLKNSPVVAQTPPKSLEELLERQWEQTAQFILDQAGSKNNAGVMLAHLHELQSENRKMQARIMELASQREFFIATNGRLRQTLMESGGLSRVLNGIQLISSDGHTQNNHDGDDAMEVDSSDLSNTHGADSGAKRVTNSLDMSTGVPQSKNGSVSSHIPSSDLDAHQHSSHGPSAAGTTGHEVTHVTNSVQGPITAYTALPNLVSSSPNQRNPLSE